MSWQQEYLKAVDGLNDEQTAAFTRFFMVLTDGHECHCDDIVTLAMLLWKRPEHVWRILARLAESGRLDVEEDGWIRLAPTIARWAPITSEERSILP